MPTRLKKYAREFFKPFLMHTYGRENKYKTNNNNQPAMHNANTMPMQCQPGQKENVIDFLNMFDVHLLAQ